MPALTEKQRDVALEISKRILAIDEFVDLPYDSSGDLHDAASELAVIVIWMLTGREIQE